MPVPYIDRTAAEKLFAHKLLRLLTSTFSEIKDLREDVIEPKKGVFKLEIAGPAGQTPPLCPVFSSSSFVLGRA